MIMNDKNENPEEKYLHGYSAEHRAFLSSRTATREAAFFLPFLKPGMRLLDCGCGMGALTTSLAEWLAPGEVIGIDREPGQVEAARDWAAEKGVHNVRFEVGNVYHIPYPDASFDAVFAFTVLEHVRAPIRAMREMRRVLKPGGVAGIYDPDYATMLQTPSMPGLHELTRLMLRFSEENASPYYARHQRQYLLKAGFARTEAFVFAIGGGNPQFIASSYQIVLKPTIESIRPWLVEHGLTDNDHLDELLAEGQAWSERPDAFFALTQCAAVGWAP
jgi:ubiquinone/menaquinone biosynthesis C-methylase UbiE